VKTTAVDPPIAEVVEKVMVSPIAKSEPAVVAVIEVTTLLLTITVNTASIPEPLVAHPVPPLVIPA
jgi:hypothetical protein